MPKNLRLYFLIFKFSISNARLPLPKVPIVVSLISSSLTPNGLDLYAKRRQDLQYLFASVTIINPTCRRIHVGLGLLMTSSLTTLTHAEEYLTFQRVEHPSDTWEGKEQQAMI